MSTDELLGLLRAHQPEIHASLTADQFTRYHRAVLGVRAAGGDPRAVRTALRRVRVSLRPLPPGSELSRLLEQFRVPGVADRVLPDEDELTALVRLLDSVEWPVLAPESAALFREIQQVLLAAPARGPDRLDTATAADPAGAGLIRLTDPDGRARYPDFQFDPGTGAPRYLVTKINRMLLADQDPWGAAGWWLGENILLAGIPADLIGRAPDEALSAAARALTDQGEFAW
ncbi:hypothetical protein ABT354_14025 [Streptomyces sp. NPDC000594]|uniref:hypothetical protein n=1 Tax=Streptomyces sp. NPDC000594 TaxID=3154261 RepID=UPI003329FB91